MVMPYRAIVFDIDGTLLDTQGRLSPATLAAVCACHRQGLALYVATATPRRLAVAKLHAAPFLTDHGAYYHGAMVVDALRGHVRHWPVPARLVTAVTDRLARLAPDVQVALQMGEAYHSYRFPMSQEALAAWGFGPQECVPYEDARRRACSKIVVWSETESLASLSQRLTDEFGQSLRLYLTDSRRWLQIVDLSASKETAIGHLLCLAGITPDEAVVFGDDVPELGMFAAFGCAVAMGNAAPPLRDAATHVTRSNDEDGVAYALSELLGLV